MPLDPNIALQVRQPEFMSPAQAISLQQLAGQGQMQQMQMGEMARQVQVRNALLQIAREPGNIDERTGSWSPAGMAKLRAVDPDRAMKAQQQNLVALKDVAQIGSAEATTAWRRAQTEAIPAETRARNLRVGEEQGKLTKQINQTFLNALDQALDRNMPNDEAYRFAMTARNKEIDQLVASGMANNAAFTDQQLDALRREQVDPNVLRAQLLPAKTAGEKPAMRTRVQGEREVQEEWNPVTRTWKQIGEGPRFARQVAPVINVGGAGGPIDKSSLAASGAQAATGMPLGQVVPGFGTASVKERKAVRDEAIRQIKQETGMDDRQAGAELAQRGIDYAAGRRSTTQLNLMLGATRQAVKQLDFNIDKTTEELKKMPGSDISPIINAIVRGEQKWTGDPRYSALFFYMQATAQESARILQGGQASVAQLYEGARKEAEKWANVNMTPASFMSGVAPAMKAEGHARIRTYQEAMDQQKVGNRGGGAPAFAPKVGDVQDGYRFKGGDPSKPASWEKVQ